MKTNTEIWEDIYAGGRSLWYPYEVAVRLVRGLAGRGELDGVVLDHGCGSGNHLEFFARLGIACRGTDVSPSSFDLVRARFEQAGLDPPELSLVDPDAPLAPQLPAYDHAFAWGSVHYNRRPKVLADIHDLVERLLAGGRFIVAVPSMNDIAARKAEAEEDGTLRLSADVSGQAGALVTIPSGVAELTQWCAGVEAEDAGDFGWTIGGERSEYLFLVGTKP